jgi:DNA-binding SARP family transcriptional activator/tetratricopeptide (TPR) repeat protein
MMSAITANPSTPDLARGKPDSAGWRTLVPKTSLMTASGSSLHALAPGDALRLPNGRFCANVGIELITLGELRCLHDGVETEVPKQKLRFALLTYLAMERSAPREKLAAMFWPGIDEERARHRLSQSLHALRKSLTTDCISTHGDQVRASADIVVDARDFGTRADVGLYERALELYQRPFLDGFFVDDAGEWERWVERQRAILARTYTHVARTAIGGLLDQQRYGETIELATRWLALDHAGEDAHWFLISGLTGAGRTREALELYDQYERQLREDVGQAPSARMQSLLRDIRAGLTQPEATRKTVPAPLDSARQVNVQIQRAASVGSLPVPSLLKHWRYAAIAVALVVALVTIVASWAGPALGGMFARIELDSLTYAVFPFAHAGQTPPLYEDQIIKEAIDQWSGLAAPDRFQVNAALGNRRTNLDWRRARAAARRLGAGRFILGTVTPSGTNLHINATLYDLRPRGAVPKSASRRMPAGGSPDSVLASLALELVFGKERSTYARPSGTHSGLARMAFARGHDRLEEWNLPAADAAFFQALKYDPEFVEAALWLAQVRSWTRKDLSEWLFAAEQAASGREFLSTRDKIVVEALLALARNDRQTACGLYERAAALDEFDFTSWFSHAHCLAYDNVVLRDARSPSGWRFRSSYYRAVNAYEHAFRRLPSAHRGLSNDLYGTLRFLLKTDPTNVRMGYPLGDTIQFAAYASWSGDTLEFIPYRLADHADERTSKVPSSMSTAVQQQRAQFLRIARAWVSKFPESAEAQLAWAVALDLQGDPNSIRTIEQARKLATDPRLREQLAAYEIIMRIKNALPENVGELRRAVELADSLLHSTRPGSETDPALMAAIAMYTGRTLTAAKYHARVTTFLRDSSPELNAQAGRLLVFAALGAPRDSITALADAFRRGSRNTGNPTFAAAAYEQVIVRAATLAFPNTRVDLAGAGSNYYLHAAQRAYLTGNPDAAQASLKAMQAIRTSWASASISADAVYPEAALLVELGDTTEAIGRLDDLLTDIHKVSPVQLDDPVRTAALLHSMILRARLAQQQRDAGTARVWASAVEVLWRNGDETTQPHMKQIMALTKSE